MCGVLQQTACITATHKTLDAQGEQQSDCCGASHHIACFTVMLTFLHVHKEHVASCSTACTPLEHEDVDTRVRVKCILDKFGYAMYFSRGVLPQNKDGQVRAYPSPFQDRPYLLHLGLACFDRAFLAQYCKMPPTPLMVRCSASWAAS